MLHGAARDPDVIGGDWGARLAEIVKYQRIALPGFSVHADDIDTGRSEKRIQFPFILPSVSSAHEAGQKLTQDHRREIDPLGPP